MAKFYWMSTLAATWNTAASSTRWSNAPGGAFTSSIPGAGDDVFFDASSPSNCIVGSGTYACRSINFTGYTRTFNHNVGTLNIGDGTPGDGNIALKLVAGMTYTGTTSAMNFVSTSTTQQTIDCGGKTLSVVTFNGANSSYLLTSDFASNGYLTITSGTFNTGSNYDVTTGAIASTGTNSRTITLNGSVITLSTTWSISGSNVTVNSGTSTINMVVPVPTGTFAGAGFVYNIVNFGSIGGFGANTITMSGNNTFDTLTFASVVSSAVNVKFTAGSTTTITNALNFNGISTNLITVASTVSGTQYTILKNNTLVHAVYVGLKDCIGAGEQKYFASNSVDNGNNVNWRFNAPNRGSQSLLGCGI